MDPDPNSGSSLYYTQCCEAGAGQGQSFPAEAGIQLQKFDEKKNWPKRLDFSAGAGQKRYAAQQSLPKNKQYRYY